MIIYPPYIADTIPAFTTDKIIIPFVMNPAADIRQVKSFRIKIMDYIKSEKLDIITSEIDKDNLSYNSETRSGTITFSPNIDLTQGQYYKFQLSFSNDNTFYTFSTASIGHCIGEAPKIEIKTSTEGFPYLGECTTPITEPVYSYRFILTMNKIILQDTGEILNNVDKDTINNDNTRTTKNNFKIKYEIKGTATLEYFITTVNGYKASTFVKVNINTDDENLGFRLNISQDNKAKNNGYVQIGLTTETTTKIKTDCQYIIERKTELNNKWDELIQFEIQNAGSLNKFIWADCSVEQGIKYQYAVRTYDSDNGAYGKRHISDTIIFVDFEHSYLTDNERQLNIKYNPKITSFKSNILEQKIDTIGSKYPFFFRNGTVNYKEFPISGLLSYLADENEAFINSKELNSDNKFYSTQLTGENITIERKFKLEALNWLNNGKPKLFRSPTEGNYVVRLMNVSLSPNDTLGRMLHTFSATAYEVGENEVEELIKNSIISFKEGGISRPSSILGLFVLGLDTLG